MRVRNLTGDTLNAFGHDFASGEIVEMNEVSAERIVNRQRAHPHAIKRIGRKRFGPSRAAEGKGLAEVKSSGAVEFPVQPEIVHRGFRKNFVTLLDEGKNP